MPYLLIRALHYLLITTLPYLLIFALHYLLIDALSYLLISAFPYLLLNWVVQAVSYLLSMLHLLWVWILNYLVKLALSIGHYRVVGWGCPLGSIYWFCWVLLRNLVLWVVHLRVPDDDWLLVNRIVQSRISLQVGDLAWERGLWLVAACLLFGLMNTRASQLRFSDASKLIRCQVLAQPGAKIFGQFVLFLFDQVLNKMLLWINDWIDDPQSLLDFLGLLLSIEHDHRVL